MKEVRFLHEMDMMELEKGLCGIIHHFGSTLEDVLGRGFYASFKNNQTFKVLEYMHKCQA